MTDPNSNADKQNEAAVQQEAEQPQADTEDPEHKENEAPDPKNPISNAPNEKKDKDAAPSEAIKPGTASGSAPSVPAANETSTEASKSAPQQPDGKVKNDSVGTILGLFLYFILFVAFAMKSAGKLNVDSVYYLPIIINLHILKFILGFSIGVFLLSLAIKELDPTYLFRKVFSAPVVVFILLFFIINLLWPRTEQTNISPSELEKHKQLITYYNLITFVVTYIILCMMFLIFIRSIGKISTFVLPKQE
jgi:hypothetical protein